jgi:hypothetical protein
MSSNNNVNRDKNNEENDARIGLYADTSID